MQLSKSTVLTMVGMFVLALFIVISIVNKSVFLDRILLCGFILSVVFIGRIRDSVHQTIPNPKHGTGRTLYK